MQKSPVICRKLSKTFQQGQVKNPALVEVDFEIPKGEVEINQSTLAEIRLHKIGFVLC